MIIEIPLDKIRNAFCANLPADSLLGLKNISLAISTKLFHNSRISLPIFFVVVKNIFINVVEILDNMPLIDDPLNVIRISLNR